MVVCSNEEREMLKGVSHFPRNNKNFRPEN